MKVMGIDPGYDRLGLAVIRHESGRPEKIIFSACLSTPRALDFNERLWQLANEVETAIKKYRPEWLAIEKIFFTTNQKTAMAVAEVRGVILYLARKHAVPIINLTPLEIKMTITGYGQANKEQIGQMVKKLLGLKQTPTTDDEMDALAIALTGAVRGRQVYPQVRLEKIAKKPRCDRK